MEIKRQASPDFDRYDLSSRPIPREENPDLSSSLPVSLLRRELSFFKNRNSMSRSPTSNMDGQLTEDVEKRTFFQRSMSNNFPNNFPNKQQRPRSASIHSSNQLGGPGSAFKKIIRGTRPSSARPLIKPSSIRLSVRGRSSSQSAEKQEANAGILKVDSAFAKIRSQLAQLSAEDISLQERLDHLTSQITHIQRYAASLSATRRGTSSAVSACCIGSPPPKPGSSHFPFEDSWEAGGQLGKHDGELLDPKCLHLKERLRSDRGNRYLGSCGSLADSEGSMSPNVQGPSCCSIIVMDYDAGKPQRFNYPSPSNFEDDVFLS